MMPTFDKLSAEQQAQVIQSALGSYAPTAQNRNLVVQSLLLNPNMVQQHLASSNVPMVSANEPTVEESLSIDATTGPKEQQEVPFSADDAAMMNELLPTSTEEGGSDMLQKILLGAAAAGGGAAYYKMLRDAMNVEDTPDAELREIPTEERRLLESAKADLMKLIEQGTPPQLPSQQIGRAVRKVPIK